jgi:hypothetical protein
MRFILINTFYIMSTIYKYRSQIKDEDTVEFYQTTSNNLGIVTKSGLQTISVALSEDQLFELIGALLRIQSNVKSEKNGK